MNISDLVQSRYTSKAYDATRQISPEHKQQLLDILRFSPSSVNSQPWHFFAVTSDEGKAKVASAVTEANVPKVLKSSMVVVFSTRTEIDDDYLNSLLDKEQQDGRFASDEAKQGQDKGRRYFVNLNSSSPEQQRQWMAKQAYISLGFFLMGSAALGLDSTPIEGFFPDKLDAALKLSDKGLTSVVVAAVGYRSEQDFNAALPKSRWEAGQVITEL